MVFLFEIGEKHKFTPPSAALLKNSESQSLLEIN
jgi:hypothetical protein